VVSVRFAAVFAACVAALGTGACGERESDYANRPRPPVPIVVNASVSTERVSVSPGRFGAGPITLIVTNQTDAAQELTLETDAVGETRPGIRQRTGPINPSGTAALDADVPRGTYAVHVGGEQIRAATLRVGPARASAQDELLQP